MTEKRVHVTILTQPSMPDINDFNESSDIETIQELLFKWEQYIINKKAMSDLQSVTCDLKNDKKYVTSLKRRIRTLQEREYKRIENEEKEREQYLMEVVVPLEIEQHNKVRKSWTAELNEAKNQLREMYTFPEKCTLLDFLQLSSKIEELNDNLQKPCPTSCPHPKEKLELISSINLGYGDFDKTYKCHVCGNNC